ncbi:MAG: Trk system potassium uptake protein TrkG [Paraeggerthella hongkongensis]|uniref:TrkH family potassium uptake protein n=1 Tax=Paraeggerthella TaxID=651554 RepID=UPI000DF7A082|nr:MULTISPECIES: potassium transporter TrkG [Paraeggerthella]MBU5405377.1 TrkH family potassium uptake protein [Paraeggerthella hongkongensis]MCD2432502.1 TrkH family potassium uptake protein [Paraeggerthella hominis]MDY3980767.1 potassium transporter TrkG [Paraeggerthella sp.]RDB58300.1 cation transporter [Paraeggerthella hongkongensis]
MWQRFTLYDVRVIGHYLGVLVLFSSLALLVPFATALAFQEWIPAANYLLTIGVSLIIGSGLRFLRIEPGRLNRQQALVVTGLAWIVLAMVATIPLHLSGHYETYLDALFDGVSGITTTGASIITDLDHLSNADNMWRFMMHLIGGLGLIVVALSFGLFGKRAGASLYMSEGRSEHVVPNVVQTTQFIAKIAVGIILIATVILTGMCLFIGMEPSRALLQSLWLSISGFMTGGFAPMSQSVMYYHSLPIELVLMLLMLLGSINFVLHSEVWKGHVEVFFKDLEIRTMVLWIAVMTCVFAASLSASAEFSNLPAMLRRGLFTVISAFSTTGFQNVTTNQLTTALSSGAFLVVAILMAVGGSGGSTSGGFKFSRMGVIMKSLVATIKEALAPDSARVVVDYNHVGRRILSPEVVKEAMTVFVLYVVTYAIGSLVGIAHGYDATQAIFESVAMASNGGISSGLAAPGMPVTLELFYILQMWAGRLEFVTLLALIVEIVVSLDPRRLVHRS